MKKENMFSKAKTERRRDEFIKQNMDTADEIIQSGKEKIDRELLVSDKDNFLIKNLKEHQAEANKKIRRTITLKKSIDDFYNHICEITGISRSEMIENLLEMAITDNKAIVELARENKEVKKLVEEFNK